MKALDHPYSDLADGQWVKGNLHTHSNFSDGSRTHQEVIDDYASRGYAFLMFSDHDLLTDHERYALLESRGMLLIPGNEVTLNGPHLLHVNADARLAPYKQRQAVIDNANSDSLIIVNHPNMGPDFDHCPAHLMKQWRGYLGIEIYNGMCGKDRGSPYALNKWDIALADGHRVWGFAGDDSHAADDVGLGWLMVNVTECSLPAIMEALREGRFYPTTGVTFRDIRVDGMHITIESDNAHRLVAIATGGKRIAVADGPSITVQVPERVKYVRFEAWGEGEQLAWTQPFWVETVSG